MNCGNELRLQLIKLNRVKSFILSTLRRITIEALQFIHALHDFSARLENSVLLLQKRKTAANIAYGNTGTFGGSSETLGYSNAAGIIRGVHNFATARKPVEALLQHSTRGGQIVRCNRGRRVGINDY